MIQAIRNFIQEEDEWDRLVDEKPPNPVGCNREEKPTSWRRATLTESPSSTGLR